MKLEINHNVFIDLVLEEIRNNAENGDMTAIKELNDPRLPSVRGIVKAYSTDNIKIWSIDDLKIDSTQIGLKGSPTNVFRSFVPVKEKNSLMIEGQNGKEKAATLISKLSDLKLI